LFGDRVTPAGVPGAMARITEATKVDTPDVTTEDRDATKSIFPTMASGQTYDFENTRHTTLASKADTNFDQMFKDPSLGTYKFNFDKDDPRYDTAQRITKGFKEARDAGYELGIIDYAREQYINIVLQSQGITGYLSNYQSMKSEPQVQPGTAKGTQTGTKTDETQTIVGSEDVGAISAKPVEGETAKETVEKTEKITIPKSTKKKEISTGDTLPAPSEIKNTKSLQIANDGFFYTDGKAQMMYKPAEREIEEAQAVAFQIRARDDISDEEKASKLAELRKLLLSELSGMGITQYNPTF
jgi:hypothetical protein